MSWMIIEKRNNEIHHEKTRPSREEAFQLAINWADECGLIPDKWTRDELLSVLERDNEYEDGEVTVKVVQVD